MKCQCECGCENGAGYEGDKSLVTGIFCFDCLKCFEVTE